MNTDQEPPLPLLESESKENLRILIFCPSEYWGSTERIALNDCLELRRAGFQVTLYTLRDSFLDAKANRLNLPIKSHFGPISTSVLRWSRLNQLKDLLLSEKYNIVHCYDFHYLWPLAHFLRNQILCSLFYTHNVIPAKFYKKFWYRPWIRRVDQTFITHPEMKDNVTLQLGMSPHRIAFLGPLKFDENIEMSSWNQDMTNMLGKDSLVLGVNIGIHHQDVEKLEHLIFGFSGVCESHPDQKIHLLLFCEKNWDQMMIYKPLRDFLFDHGLLDKVLFVEGAHFVHWVESLDCWIGLLDREAMEDFALRSLYHKVPILMSRTSTSSEIINEYGNVGRTFRKGDSGEFRRMANQILENKETFSKDLELASERLVKKARDSHYLASLVQQYEAAVRRRARFFEKKKPSKPL